MGSPSLLPIFLALVLLTALPGMLPAPPSWLVRPAGAQSPPPAPPPATTPLPEAQLTAAEHYRAGRQAFLRQRFEEALTHFQKAHQLEPRDFLLFNIAVCHERLNRPAEALAHYRRYLRRVPADAAGLEERLRGLSRQLEPCGIRIEAGVPGSDVWVDGRFAGQLPLKHPIWAAPGGEVVIRVLRAGYHPYQTSLRVQAGTAVSLTISQVPAENPETKADPIVTILSAPVSLTARPPADLRAEPVPARGSQVPITLGVTGTLLISAGLCLGAYAWWKSGQTDNLPSWEWEQRDQLARDSRRAAWGADALILSGAALVAVFGWMTLQE